MRSLWVNQYYAPFLYLFPIPRVCYQSALAKVLSLPLSSALLKCSPQVFVQCPPKRHFTKVTEEGQNCSLAEPHLNILGSRTSTDHSPPHLSGSG